MPEFFALLFMILAALLAAGFAINYFWQTGLKLAFGYAAFFMAMILVFGASGIWLHASRHSWGVLAPIFALMLALGWLLLKYAPRIWEKWLKFQGNKKDK